MKLKESKSLNSRNTKNTITIGTTSRNELMEKKESNKRDDEDISNEKLKENKKINHNRIHLMNEKEDEMNSSISKRSSENKLLLKNNPYQQKSLDVYKDFSFLSKLFRQSSDNNNLDKKEKSEEDELNMKKGHFKNLMTKLKKISFYKHIEKLVDIRNNKIIREFFDILKYIESVNKENSKNNINPNENKDITNNSINERKTNRKGKRKRKKIS